MRPALPPFNRWVSWGRGDELDTWLDLQARRGDVAWCKHTDCGLGPDSDPSSAAAFLRDPE